MSKLNPELFPLIDQEGRRFALLYPTGDQIKALAREATVGGNSRALSPDEETAAVRLYRDSIGSDAEAGKLVGKYGQQHNAHALARESMAMTPIQSADRYLEITRAVNAAVDERRIAAKEKQPSFSRGEAAVGASLSALSGSLAVDIGQEALKLKDLAIHGLANQSDVTSGYAVAGGLAALAVTGAVVAAPTAKRALRQLFNRSADVHAGYPLVARYPFGLNGEFHNPHEQVALRVRMREASRTSTPEDFMAIAGMTEARMRQNVANEMAVVLPKLGVTAENVREHNVVDIREVAKSKGVEAPAPATSEQSLISAVYILSEIAAERGIRVPPLDVERAHREGIAIVADKEHFIHQEKDGQLLNGFAFAREASREVREQVTAFVQEAAPAQLAVAPDRNPLKIAEINQLIEPDGTGR